MKKDPKYGRLSVRIYYIALYKHFVRPGWKPVNKKLTVFKDEDEKKGLLFDCDIYQQKMMTRRTRRT